MGETYKYSSITVNTKTGRKYEEPYCDYYIQDGILTVFRSEVFCERSYERRRTYKKFEEHFPIENVESLMCVE